MINLFIYINNIKSIGYVIYTYLLVSLLLPTGNIYSQDGITHLNIECDTSIYGYQNVNAIKIDKVKFDVYQLDIAYSDTLTLTSSFAIQENAIAAINGGFFNMKEGGSVSYLEHQDSIIARTQNEIQKRASRTSMLNAALIIEKEGDIKIEAEQADSIYYNSDEEFGVLGAGPLLLLKGNKVAIRSTSFSSNKHPRTCICETKESIMLITIDGRNPKAEGMTLYELQDFLLLLKCFDAINMDGGGSTTMWHMNKGIVNTPSDFTGERPAANAILIKYK